PEIWVLGTGEGSVKVAAQAGAGYVYAHFAKPLKSSAKLMDSYKKQFRPSALLDTPKTIVSVIAVVGETEEEAEDLAKAFDLWLLFVESDTPPPYYPSVETAKQRGFSANEMEKVERNRKRMLIGTAE